MNWLEFVAECETEMQKANVKPEDVTMRVEVSDSYYDSDITPMSIVMMDYEKPYLVLWGK